MLIIVNFIADVMIFINVNSATMTNLDKKNFKIRLLKLALLKCTGTPADLAFRFGISDRSVKRFVSELRDEGVNLNYCHLSVSYLTDETAKNYLKHVI